MNSKSFKTIFSKRLGGLVAVGEHAASQGKGQGQGQGAPCMAWAGFVGVLATSFAAVSLAWAQPAATALPTGGAVAQGAVGISTSGAAMTMQQTTAKAVVNWQSFDIGKEARVNIQQPGADSVMLNRVTGPNPSQIFGQLSANGQVVLVNPNGVLFGRDGSVTATSFTASTLGITDANFMTGNMQFERNGSTAGVVNQGSIRANGGYVALLGASVSNEGQIETRGGTAYLAAAEAVRIPVSGSGRIKLELSPAQINTRVANTKEGTIVTQGGQVYMQAAALQDAVASIIQSGRIDTTGEQGGAVHVLADGGQIKVDGSITANSTKAPAGGDIYIGRDKDTNVLAAVGDASGATLESKGGFVETSGRFLKVDGARVQAAHWLLDPDNIEITNGTATSGYSAISAATLSTALTDGTTVTVNTTAGGGSYNSAVNNGGTGKILVTSAIAKSTGAGTATLNLIADDTITLNNSITASSGSLNLGLTANNGISGNGSGNIAINGGNLTLNAVNASATGILSGVISGTGTTLTKTGAGQVTLTGANTYTGATTVSAGTLQVGNGAASGQLGDNGTVFSAVSVASGADLTFFRSGTLQLRNAISGAGTINFTGVNLAGQSIYVLGGNNSSLSGTINATGSRLQVTNANQLGTAGINVSNGGTLFVNGITTVSNALSLGGMGWEDGGGFGRLGALRLTGATYSGNITLASNTSIGAVNSTGIVSGVISGLAGLQINASSGITGGNLYFTNANTYSGTTTIASGTLQLGASGATGTLGSGAVVNNGTLNFNRSNAMTVGNTISGTGAVHQTGSGTTTLTADNSYSGTTTVSGGTLELGSGGTTGTWGNTTGVTLSNNATLRFNKGINTTIDKTITGTGNVTTNITGDLVLDNNISLAAGNTINLSASGAITQSAGTLTAGNLFMTATTGGIGTSVNHRIQTNVSSLSLSSGGSQFVKEADSVTLSARTTVNGSVDVQTTNGTLSVGTVNSLNGVVTAGAAGHVVLVGLSSTGTGLAINQQVNASQNISLTGTSTSTSAASSAFGLSIGLSRAVTAAGDVTLNGTTSSARAADAGIFNSGSVNGKNIVLNALATSTADVLGYRGGAGSLTAVDALSVNAETKGTGTGFYMWQSSAQAGTGMQIVGKSSSGSGVALASSSQLNNTSGALVVDGSSGSTTGLGAIELLSSAISGSGGVLLTASQGSIRTDFGAANTITNNGSGAVVLSAGPALAAHAGGIDGTRLTITQNSNGGVVVSTSGTGNVTVPGIVNNGTGDVVVAAGTALAAGDGTGGQLKTVAGNTIGQGSSGKTVLYSGNVSDTGALSHLASSLATLSLYADNGVVQNAAANTAYLSNGSRNTIANGASAQVMFREKVAFSLLGANAVYSYGDANTAQGQGAAMLGDVKTALKLANVDSGTNVISRASGAGALKIKDSLLIDDMTAVLGGAVYSSTSSFLNARTTGYDYTLSKPGSAPYLVTLASGQETRVVVNPRQLTVTLGSVGKTYDGNTHASLSASHFQLGGFVSGEGAAVTQTTGAYASPNVNANGGTGLVSASLLPSHFSAGPGTLLSNYTLPTTASGNVGTISPAALTLKVGNTTAFVTQDARTAFDTGLSYSGLQGTDTIASALVQVPTASDRTYTGSTFTPAVGRHSAVYGLGFTPAAQNGNYTITVQSGDLQVIPADKLLIHIAGQTDTYGNRSASNAGQAAGVSAQYCLVASNCNGANLYNLSLSAGAGNRWVGTDNTNTTITFDTVVNTAGQLSGGGFLKAGNHSWDVLNLSASNSGQFNGHVVNSGTLVLGRLALTPTANAVSKTYDGTASAAGVALVTAQAKAGDAVSAVAGSGSYSTRNVVNNDTVTFDNLNLQGADSSNYVLTAFSVQGTGSITPRSITVAGSRAQDKTYDGTRTATVLPGQLLNLVPGESLGLSASGHFDDALVGANKLVNASYGLLDSANALASNYVLSNPTEVLRASILSTEVTPRPAPVSLPSAIFSFSSPAALPLSSRVAFSGGASAATATAAGSPAAEARNRDDCAVLRTDNCLCQETQLPEVDVCLASSARRYTNQR